MTLRTIYFVFLITVFATTTTIQALFDEGLLDRHNQKDLCIITWNQYPGYAGPSCPANATPEWGCTCANTAFDCNNYRNSVTCVGGGFSGTCVRQWNGKPMCAKPLAGDMCYPCTSSLQCASFQECVYIGERPRRGDCRQFPSMICGGNGYGVCMSYHNV
jgi:hypothetical protein